jgi:hypothetical protein
MTVFRNPIPFCFRTIRTYIIYLTTMWILVFTAALTLLLWMSIHYGYEYLKRTLTVPKIHDVETIESKKRMEIETILEEI